MFVPPGAINPRKGIPLIIPACVLTTPLPQLSNSADARGLSFDLFSAEITLQASPSGRAGRGSPRNYRTDPGRRQAYENRGRSTALETPKRTQARDVGNLGTSTQPFNQAMTRETEEAMHST